MDFSIFTAVYIMACGAVFYGVRRDWRIYTLLGFSFGYCYWMSRRAAWILLAVTVLTYCAGCLIFLLKRKRYPGAAKILWAAGIAGAALSLFIMKEVIWGARLLRMDSSSGIFRHFLLPLGYSYYIFQVISYLTEVYRGNIMPELNPFSLGLYLCWFPKFISGPIERPEAFLLQLRTLEKISIFDKDRLKDALCYIVYGYFLKLVIADRLGVYVDQLFTNPGQYHAFWLMAGSLFYTIQIYGDFAGYSCVAVGVSRLFGIGLVNNFKTPYLAENISDFWSRWHRSLSRWLRDYIYIPLGGNRKGLQRKYLNMMAVFLICGIWHGEGTHFFLWGLLHGILSIADDYLEKKGYDFAVTGWSGRILTFCAVSFAWIFFRAPSAKLAFQYIFRMFTAFGGMRFLGAQQMELGLDAWEIWILIVAGIFTWGLSFVSYMRGREVPQVICRCGEWKRGILLYLMAISILILGIYGNNAVNNFIYMQF